MNEDTKKRQLFLDTFLNFSIPINIRECLWNYYAYGLSPGGFCTAVLENDFLRAVLVADSFWDGKGLKHLGKWIMNYAPKVSYGSAEAVEAWMELSDIERKDILIEANLYPTVFDILRSVPK